MIIIIANINGAVELKGFEAQKFYKACSLLGIEQPVYVQVPRKLKAILEENRSQSCLLFSNFPPDHTYNENEKIPGVSEEDNLINSELIENYYSKSTLFFREIFTNYSFIGIHFITGATKYMVSDFLLRSLSPRAKVSVTRKSTLRDHGLGYEHNRRVFILKKIEEAVIV